MYLVSWSDTNGYHDMTFNDYQEAIEFLADLEDNCTGSSFTTLNDADDEREEHWYDANS